MKYYLLVAIALTLTFTGCSSPLNIFSSSKSKRMHKNSKHTPVRYEQPTAKKSMDFQEAMRFVAMSTQDDDRYNKMTLNTPQRKAWFKSLMYLLWDRQITRNQFITKGLSKYPDHRYEFTFVANGFQHTHN